jgi:2-polyprenyl-6-methoxyphenol hydroxylase-like FAD-dependent oxidoreductase
MNVLISGASVAGPVLAYWLCRYGFSVTVVEQATAIRKTGGHAVDLFTPAMDIVERMGALEAVLERRTGTESFTVYREGSAKPITIDLRVLMAAISRRHVEIMRDDLSDILHAATRDDVEYMFGDSVAAIGSDGDVHFEGGAQRRFDLVIGADGLHSTVRRLVFGPESDYTSWLGGYIAVASVPNSYGLRNGMRGITGVNRMIGVYGARHLADARAFFLFRPPAQLEYHHRDQARQRQLLRAAFADLGGDTPQLLDQVDRSDTFYFDAITQLRMDTWSRGRVTLVGDAGYCPGPAVGGSTSLAVVGAFVLAGELAVGGGDPTVAYPAYEAALSNYVQRSRAFALTMANRLIPTSRAQVWAMTTGAKLITSLPAPMARAVARSGTRLGLHDSFRPTDYPSIVGSTRG